MAESIVDFEDAVRIVLQHAASAARATPTPSHPVPLLDALGLVLSQDVLADRDQPGFDRSTRDGFAIPPGPWRAGATLRVIGAVRAGEFWQGPAIAAGEAIQIMTGAPMPDGAGAVVMVEHVLRSGSTISPADERTIGPGENIVPRGSEARAGQRVLAAGTRLDAAGIALAAACGCATLEVFPRPAVSIIATGDELVELDQQPQPHQIRNSNSYALAALVTASGGTPHRLPVARDTREDIRQRIRNGREAGLLLLSGGVSMGDYDFVEEVLSESAAEFFFTGVRMQPGRPVVFGRLPAAEGFDQCYFFGLPGNPISTEVTFHCFAELFLRVSSGETDVALPWAQATLSAGVAAKPNLTRLLPARREGVRVEVSAWQGSGDLAANARSNCYAELLPGRPYQPGEVIRVLLR